MNRLRKISVFVAFAFVIAAFYILPAGAAMSSPISKYNDINSMTNKTDITINLSASGLSAADREEFDNIQPFLDNMRISTVSKYNRNQARTQADEYMHLMVNIGGTPLDTSMWVKSDLTGKTPAMKEIIRVPQMFSDYLPTEAQGKEYAVLNMTQAVNSKVDQSKLASATNKLADAITNSLAGFPTGLLPVKDRGTGTLKTPEGVINVHNYTLKLDDTTLKLLMKYSVNDLAKNKDVITALKDYLIAVNGSNDTEAKDLSNQIDKGLPGFIKDFNNSMDSFKNTKIVGKKGIVINYSLNSDGYIVNSNGVIDIVAKASTLSQAENAVDHANISKDNGTYDLTVKFNSITYNINKGTKIIFPYLDNKNSFDFIKTMEAANDLSQVNQ